MGRPRKNRAGDGPASKTNFCIVLDWDLDRRLDEARDQTGLTASAVVRDVLERHLGEWLQEHQGGGPARLVLSIPPDVGALLAAAEKLTGLAPAAVAQTVLAEHVTDYLASARERGDQLRGLAEEAVAAQRTPPAADADEC
jgi:hypothetical protein